MVGSRSLIPTISDSHEGLDLGKETFGVDQWFGWGTIPDDGGSEGDQILLGRGRRVPPLVFRQRVGCAVSVAPPVDIGVSKDGGEVAGCGNADPFGFWGDLGSVVVVPQGRGEFSQFNRMDASPPLGDLLECSPP